MKVMIAIPTVRGLSPETAMGLLALERLASKGEVSVECDYKILSNDSLLPRVRNTAVSHFLEGDSDYFITIDDDIGFAPEAIPLLVSNDRDIVCAMYPMRSPEFPIYSARPKLEMMNDREFNLNVEEGHLIELDYASTGFLLVRRNVVEAMAKAYEDEAYDENLPSRFKKKTYNLYNPMVFKHPNGKTEYLSEDWAFCERARRIGFRIWGDTNVSLGHMGRVSMVGKNGKELIDALVNQSKDIFSLYCR